MFKTEELIKASAGRLISGSRDSVFKGISIDSRTIKKDEVFIAIKGSKFDGDNFIDEAVRKGAGCVVREFHPAGRRTPDVRRRTQDAGRRIVVIEVKNTIKSLGDIARFRRREFALPTIAVSGSNGKTTTKEMIAWVLSEKYKVLKNEGTQNNHIGLPQALLNLNPEHQLCVLELGTNHFNEIEYLAKICLPNIGVITNIGPAHLEYFGDLNGVFCEKAALFENLQKPRIAVLNADDNYLRKGVMGKGSRNLWPMAEKPFVTGVGIERMTDFFAANIEWQSGKIKFLVNGKHKIVIDTCGRHNVYNALMAISIARIFGIPYMDIAERLAAFDFPSGRFKVIKRNKTMFIDDTYNSNPSSFKQALDALADFKINGRKIVVMGDMLELGAGQERLHCHAGRAAAGVCDIFITVGGLSKLAGDAARACGMNNIFNCESSQEAGEVLFKKISPDKNDLVLVKGSRKMRMEEVFKKKA
ncbi:MAG: UDP-N-acetylmuramoyl-tripeptide--D-alanyl-D-alanine ligase [Candidatus Omnitrophota bacterium]